MNQKGFINIILILIVVVLAGAVGYFTFTRNKQQLAPSRTMGHSQSLTYSDIVLEFKLGEDGGITFTVPYSQPLYSCTVEIPQLKDSAENGHPREATELEYLFGLARSQDFMNAKKEYLPKPGSFTAQGHDTKPTVIFSDSDGGITHRVRYSSEPIEKVPPAVVELGNRMNQYLDNHSYLLKEKCGQFPNLLVID